MVVTEDDELSTSVPTTRSSARLKNEKTKSQKMFNIFISKNEYYDYESQQQTTWSEDTPVELTAKESANQPISVVAELSRQAFNTAPLDVSSAILNETTGQSGSLISFADASRT